MWELLLIPGLIIMVAFIVLVLLTAVGTMFGDMG